jgi:hypothetical protein
MPKLATFSAWFTVIVGIILTLRQKNIPNEYFIFNSL